MMVNKLTVNSNSIDIQVLHRRVTLDTIGVNRIIQTEDFLAAWEEATSWQRAVLITLLDAIDVKGVRRWMQSFDGLHSQTLAQLHRLASNNHVPNYKRMNKDELITVLYARGIVC